MGRQLKDRSVLDVFCIKFSKVVERYTKYIIVLGFVAIASSRKKIIELYRIKNLHGYEELLS